MKVDLHILPELEEQLLVATETANTNAIVLNKDSHNTDEWLIESLIDVCNHHIEQAEQCSFIVHYKGKCAVKEGSMDKLKPMKDALIDRGLNATIE